LGVPSIWKDAYFSIDGVDLSGYVRSLSVDMEVDAVEYTVMGSSFHVNISGLQNWAVEAEFNQETSTVDAALSPVTRGTSAAYLLIRQFTTAIGGASSVNKGFIAADARVFAYRPYGGEIGGMAIATASFGPGGAAVFTTCSTA